MRQTLIAAGLIACALPLLAACNQGGAPAKGAVEATPMPMSTGTPPEVLEAAISDPARAADRAIDAQRKPMELTAFTGVEPGDKVVDLIPGNGYFSRIFSKVVGDKGRVYLVWPDAYRKEAATDFGSTSKLVQSPDYKNMTILTQPAASFTAPEPLDLVFISMNYHDYPDEFMGKLDPAALDRQVFAALKPGGTFVVIDHATEAGAGLRDTETLHRIDPETVKAQAKAAGFVFDGEDKALANPADDHKLPVFDPKVRGKTDRFALRFRKPG